MRKFLYIIYYLLTVCCIVFLGSYFTGKQLISSVDVTGLIGAGFGFANFITAAIISFTEGNRRQQQDTDDSSTVIKIHKDREDLMELPEPEEEKPVEKKEEKQTEKKEETVISGSKTEKTFWKKLKGFFVESEDEDEMDKLQKFVDTSKKTELKTETVSEMKKENESISVPVREVQNLNIANNAYTAVNGEDNSQLKEKLFDNSDIEKYVEPLSVQQKEYIQNSDDSYLNTVGLPQLRITTNIDNKAINSNIQKELIVEPEKKTERKAVVYGETDIKEEDYNDIEKLEKMEDILNVAIPILVVALFCLGIYLLYGKLFG